MLMNSSSRTRRYFLPLFLAALSYLWPISSATADRGFESVRRYVEQSGTSSETVFWRLFHDKGYRLTYEKKEETHVTCTDSVFSTLSWSMVKADGSSSLVAERHGNTIIVHGRLNGATLEKRLQVDDAPWYQATSLSFSDFALSKQDEVRFWTLRPGTAKVYKLKATKKGMETITVGGQPVEAIKIELCLNGWLAPFWKSHYWFRATDGVFLRFSGQAGPGDDTPFSISYLGSD